MLSAICSHVLLLSTAGYFLDASKRNLLIGFKLVEVLDVERTPPQGTILAKYPPVDEALGVHFRDFSNIILPCSCGYFCPAEEVESGENFPLEGLDWSSGTSDKIPIDRDVVYEMQQEMAHNVRDRNFEVVALPRAADNVLFVPHLVGGTVEDACGSGKLAGGNWENICRQVAGQESLVAPVRISVFRFKNAATSWGAYCGVLFNATHRTAVPTTQAGSQITQKRLRRFQTLGRAVTAYCHEGQSHFMYETLVELGILLHVLPSNVPILVPINDKVQRWLDIMDVPRARILPFEPDVTYVAKTWYGVLRASPGGAESRGSFVLGRNLIASKTARAKNRIVLLNRSDRQVRSLSNHGNLLAALRERFPDYDVVDFIGGAHSPAGVQALLAEAAVLVGPHGGGFLNMVFLPPEASVVEIGYTGHGGMHFPVMFPAMAHGLALDYTLVLGTGTYTSSITCHVPDVVQAVSEGLVKVKARLANDL